MQPRRAVGLTHITWEGEGCPTILRAGRWGGSPWEQEDGKTATGRKHLPGVVQGSKGIDLIIPQYTSHGLGFN